MVIAGIQRLQNGLGTNNSYRASYATVEEGDCIQSLPFTRLKEDAISGPAPKGEYIKRTRTVRLLQHVRRT